MSATTFGEYRTRYWLRRAAGLCVRCGAVAGKRAMCRPCAEKHLERVKAG